MCLFIMLVVPLQPLLSSPPMTLKNTAKILEMKQDTFALN